MPGGEATTSRCAAKALASKGGVSVTSSLNRPLNVLQRLYLAVGGVHDCPRNVPGCPLLPCLCVGLRASYHAASLLSTCANRLVQAYYYTSWQKGGGEASLSDPGPEALRWPVGDRQPEGREKQGLKEGRSAG